MADDSEVIGGVQVDITGDFSQLDQAFDDAVAAAVANGNTLSEAIASAMASANAAVDDTAASLASLTAAAGDTQQQLSLFGDAVDSIPFADATGQLNLFTDEIEQLSTSAVSTASGIDNLGEASAEAGAQAEEAARGFSAFGSAMIEFGEALAVTEALKEFGTEALETYGAVQQATIALTALTGSSSQATETIESLKQQSIELAVPFESLVTAAQSMTAKFSDAGVSTEQITAVLTAAANAAAATGGSFDRVDSSLQRMALSGTAGARQLATLGISLDALAVSLGTTSDNAVKAFKALDVGDRIEVLTEALGKYEGVAEQTAGGIIGAWQNLKTETEFAMEGVGQAIAPMVTSVVQWLSQDLLPGITSAIDGFQQLPEPIKDTAIAFGVLAAAVPAAAIAFGGFAISLYAINGAMPVLVEGLAALGIEGGFAGVGAAALAAAPYVVAFGAALAALHFTGTDTALLGWFQAIKDEAPGIANNFHAINDVDFGPTADGIEHVAVAAANAADATDKWGTASQFLDGLPQILALLSSGYGDMAIALGAVVRLQIQLGSSGIAGSLGVNPYDASQGPQLAEKTKALADSLVNLYAAYSQLGVTNYSQLFSASGTSGLSDMQAFVTLAAQGTLGLGRLSDAADTLKGKLDSAFTDGAISAEKYNAALDQINATIYAATQAASGGLSQAVAKPFDFANVFGSDSAAQAGYLAAGIEELVAAYQAANPALMQWNALLDQQSLDAASVSGDLAGLVTVTNTLAASIASIPTFATGAPSLQIPTDGWAQYNAGLAAANQGWLDLNAKILAEDDVYKQDMAAWQSYLDSMDTGWSVVAYTAQTAIGQIEQALSKDLATGLVDAIDGTKNLTQAFITMGEQLAKTVLTTIIQGALTPLLNILDTLITKIPLVGNLIQYGSFSAPPAANANLFGQVAPGVQGYIGQNNNATPAEIAGATGQGGYMGSGTFAGPLPAPSTAATGTGDLGPTMSLGIAALQALNVSIEGLTTAVGSSIAAQYASTAQNISLGNVVQGSFGQLTPAINTATDSNLVLGSKYDELDKTLVDNTSAVATVPPALADNTTAVDTLPPALADNTGAIVPNTAAIPPNTDALDSVTKDLGGIGGGGGGGGTGGGLTGPDGSPVGSSSGLGGLAGLGITNPIGMAIQVASTVIQAIQQGTANNTLWLIASSSQGTENQLIDLQNSANSYWPQLVHLTDIWGTLVNMQGLLQATYNLDVQLYGQGGPNQTPIGQGIGQGGNEVVSDNTTALNDNSGAASQVTSSLKPVPGALGDLKGPITALNQNLSQLYNKPFVGTAAQGTALAGGIGAPGVSPAGTPTEGLFPAGSVPFSGSITAGEVADNQILDRLTSLFGYAGGSGAPGGLAGSTITSIPGPLSLAAYQNQQALEIAASHSQYTGIGGPAGVSFTPSSLATALVPTFDQLMGKLQNVADGLSRPMTVTVQAMNPLQAFVAGVRNVGVKV